MTKKFKCCHCGKIPERIGCEVHEDTYGICSNTEDGASLLDGVESMPMVFRASVHTEIGNPVYCPECGETKMSGIEVAVVDEDEAEEPGCSHEYIKAINYEVEDGVECRKCGALWVPRKETK